jgi:hypothetical protein
MQGPRLAFTVRWRAARLSRAAQHLRERLNAAHSTPGSGKACVRRLTNQRSAPTRRGRSGYKQRRSPSPFATNAFIARCLGVHGGIRLEGALAQGRATVSDEPIGKGVSAPACPRCRARMDEVVHIAPVAGEPGLIAYECPKCGYLTSVLRRPNDGT